MRVSIKEFVKQEGLDNKAVITFVKSAMDKNLKGHVYKRNGEAIEIDQYAADFIKEYFAMKNDETSEIVNIGKISLAKTEEIEDDPFEKEIADMEKLILSKTGEIVNSEDIENPINIDMDYDMQKIYEMRLQAANSTIEMQKKMIAEQNKTIEELNKAMEVDALIILKLKQKLNAKEIEVQQYEESLMGTIKMKIRGKKKK